MMNDANTLRKAQRMCSQCRASKKKCDKILPGCSRCLRLALECTYATEKPDGSDAGIEKSDPKFDEIFRRLDRIEAHVFSSQLSSESGIEANLGTPDTNRPTSEIRAERMVTDEDHQNEEPPQREASLSNNPALLKRKDVDFDAGLSVFKLLNETGGTFEHIRDQYFSWTSMWLPMISPVKFDEDYRLMNNFQPSSGFLLKSFAMHLIVTPPSNHPPVASISDSPWYRNCKYHFGQYVSVGECSLHVVQAGILIALFEHTQCVADCARLTLGICGRIAYELELDVFVTEQSTKEQVGMTVDEEEKWYTWWDMILLDSYFNMPPVLTPKQPAIHAEPLQDRVDELHRHFYASSSRSLTREHIEWYIMEHEAAKNLRRVQTLIRENRRKDVSHINDVAPQLWTQVNGSIKALKERQHSARTFAGIAVNLSAALHLHCWFVEKKGSVDMENLLPMRHYIQEILDVMLQCRSLMGFTENYLEQCAPSWISLAYLALRAYKLICSAKSEQIQLGLDMRIFYELLEYTKSRYKLAERCLELLQTT